MSYLHELECHCLFGGSADVESIGAIDALMSLDPANLSVDVEATTALESPYINTDFHPDVTLETSSAIRDDDVFLHLLIETFSEIEDGLTASYSVGEDLEAVTEIESDFLDKFHGDFPEYFDLSNYENSQKLHPSGDVTVSEFVGDDGGVFFFPPSLVETVLDYAKLVEDREKFQLQLLEDKEFRFRDIYPLSPELQLEFERLRNQ